MVKIAWRDSVIFELENIETLVFCNLLSLYEYLFASEKHRRLYLSRDESNLWTESPESELLGIGIIIGSPIQVPSNCSRARVIRAPIRLYIACTSIYQVVQKLGVCLSIVSIIAHRYPIASCIARHEIGHIQIIREVTHVSIRWTDEHITLTRCNTKTKQSQ